MTKENNSYMADTDAAQLDINEFIIDSTGAIVYVIDLETLEILYANAMCKKEFGDVIGGVCFTVLQEGREDICGFCPMQDGRDTLKVGDSFEWENTNSRNGKTYVFNDRVIVWKNGRLAKIHVGIDVTEQKRLEEELLLKKDEIVKTFETLTDTTIEGLIIFNEHKECIRVNRVAPELFGYTSQEMIGRHAFEFVAPESRDFVSRVIKIYDQEPYEAMMLRKDGSKFPAILRGRDLDLDGRRIRVSAIMDITAIKEKEQRIMELAKYDSLTSLPNRMTLAGQIGGFLKASKRSGVYGAILFVDLDNFKAINDTKGHFIGDLVLMETAARISKITGERDNSARFGGDEFVILLDTGEQDRMSGYAKASKMATDILSAIEEPYLVSGYDFRISASVGIAMFCGDDTNMDELLKYADSAMYHAKANGRNTYSFFDPSMQRAIEEKSLITQKLRHAIASDKIEVYYQKQVGPGGLVIGVEALARWNDDELGFVTPACFIPLAEESGLIVALGESVLKKVIKQLKEWEDDEQKRHWRLSVNISSKQFEQKDFTDKLCDMLLAQRAQAEGLRLELTESLLFKNTHEAIRKLSHLKELGITLSIDDFGTGYSSLSYLKKLPIDELKIDKSFISDLATDANDETIVQTVISIGRKFGMEVIAEGVETKEQLERLIDMGCEYFQGYYFAKPMRAQEL